MTDAEMNVMLAKAENFEPRRNWDNNIVEWQPNYFADLNACARAEATLTEEEWTEYLKLLLTEEKVNSLPPNLEPYEYALATRRIICCATAIEKAEALCKIIIHRKAGKECE
jgi:hypothetical protein